jgi:hypothetical protein
LIGERRLLACIRRQLADEIDSGSARVSRAGFGVSPKQSFLQKSAIARTQSPTRETRALPGNFMRDTKQLRDRAASIASAYVVAETN